MGSIKRKDRKRAKKAAANLSSTKKRIFLFITILLPVIIIVLLETGLRIFKYGEDIPLFVPTPDESSKYYGINLNISQRYFTNLSISPTPRKDLFLKVKPENGYRIFVLGGSTAAGFPFGNNLTFPRILNRRLADAFPDKKIEVVNTAMTAINSYTQLDFMDEILEHKPDLILIYSGHNEFYGALGVGSVESIGKSRWIIKTTLFLQKFKTYQLLRNLINELTNLFGDDYQEAVSDPDATMMESIVKNKIIPYKSEVYEAGKYQFRENIKEIIKKAREAGVEVIISELVSNVRDQEPFESVEYGEYFPADNVYKTAVEKEREGKFNEAKNDYYLAKDLDALRFRASEEFNSIINNIAAEFKIPVVPMKEYFENNSANKLIGNNLMYEHLHPNYEGYFIMADAFFNTARDAKLLSSQWSDPDIKPSSFYKLNWGFTKLDSLYASLTIAQLKGRWPFVKDNYSDTYFRNFKPITKTDSILAKILVERKMSLEQGHIELAKYYESRGEFESAFKEFNALIYTVPYLDLFYEPAIKILIRIGDYNKALDILKESLSYQETAFAYQWIGQIQLINGGIKKGIKNLEKALKLGGKDHTLLYNLSRAYYETGQWQKGDLILNKLNSQLPNSTFISDLKEFRKMSYEKFNSQNKKN